ncbi:NAD(P)-dependent oxidoreductase [Kangiella shandongensis]|uniref:NAD(P)-dependent oxidoreductase n=1 Tax=Kangiella shandongensis TaxID=2763258 RepID=UPI001CBDC410|nr:NAD(P)-dependent oxidoreductase [Kangiella shandongensis]
MKLVLFGVQDFEKPIYRQKNKESFNFELSFVDSALTEEHVSQLASASAISIFANNPLDKALLSFIRAQGVKLILLRSTGYDHVDITAAKELGMTVMNVPGYSPQSVAEHAVTLLLCLYRKMFLLQKRLINSQFALNGNLGESVYDKTIGVIGVGDIGSAYASIMKGFGCRVIGYDPAVSESKPELLEWVSLNEIWQQADVISLHCPLNETTNHLINKETIEKMKQGVTIINTARGPVIRTTDLIDALDTNKVRYAGLDVYEYEKNLFFKDHAKSVDDAMFNRFKQMDNVVITPHIAFYTNDSIDNIAYTTLLNVQNFNKFGDKAPNVVE